ncbi:anti-sigma factor [Zavarzinella formosa]|uniref:hypothetical protein n=1 Tax=Zavarzinella formosa TaxID=360055 RepID=UPI0002D65382|nr:hypothetical protein [Zavarzinella formosa]
MSEPKKKKSEDPAPPDVKATEELVAYLDGELDTPDAEAMATKISLNPVLRAEADSLKRTWDVLDMLPRPKPSASFASKTISQVLPVPAIAPLSEATTRPSAPVTMVAVPAVPASGRAAWIAAGILTVLFGGLGGYFGRSLLKPPPDERGHDSEMINELSLLKNARLYRHVNDMEYLRKLDSPELFADDD